MANSVFRADELTTVTGETLSVCSNTVKNQRIFMKKFDEFIRYEDPQAKIDKDRADAEARGEEYVEPVVALADLPDDQFRIMSEMAVICLNNQSKAKVDVEWVEDNLDLDTIVRVIYISSGISMGDSAGDTNPN